MIEKNFKKKVDISFLILHYLTIDDTVKCVDSIRKKNKCSFHIIIVDNASPNNTGIKLKELYNDARDVTVLITKSNLGFANGNNFGYEYFKNNLVSDFLVVMNNDIVLLQDDILGILSNILSKNNNTEKIAAIGPKIILPDGSYNPINFELPSVFDIKKRIFKIKIMLLLDYIKLYKLSDILYTSRFGTCKLGVDSEKTSCNYENIILHGSFIVLTKEYINKYSVIFNPTTFLYCEEELFYISLMNKGLKTVYTADYVVFHNEDSSTNALTKDKTQKRIFKNNQLLKSYRCLLNELKIIK